MIGVVRSKEWKGLTSCTGVASALPGLPLHANEHEDEISKNVHWHQIKLS